LRVFVAFLWFPAMAKEGRMNPTLLEKLARLSPEDQALVLDYVDGLLLATAREEDRHWSSLSLQAAQSGLVEESGVEYGLEDLVERFQ